LIHGYRFNNIDCRRGNPANHATPGGQAMKNPLDSIIGTIIAGFVLTLLLYLFARNFLGA
jgi:hypothetical protein